MCDDGNAVNTKQYGSGVVFLSFCPIFRILKIFDDSLELFPEQPVFSIQLIGNQC